jgi:hypothetical protein
MADVAAATEMPFKKRLRELLIMIAIPVCFCGRIAISISNLFVRRSTLRTAGSDSAASHHNEKGGVSTTALFLATVKPSPPPQNWKRPES